MRDHAVVGADGEALDVPAADHRLVGVRLGEQPRAADVLRDATELRGGRDVADDDATGRERVGHDIHALPRSEHVEDDPIDGCRCHRLRQRLAEVADDDLPVVGLLAEERLDVGARDVGEVGAALEGDESPLGPDGAEEPERQGAGADPGLHDDGSGEDVGLREDLRGILRVDDRGAARHRHDEVAQERPEREVLVAAAVGDDRAVGLADELGVLEHAVVGVQLAVGAQRDRVQAALGAGELDAVSDAEGPARPWRCHRADSRRWTWDRWNSATSCAVRPSRRGPDDVGARSGDRDHERHADHRRAGGDGRAQPVRRILDRDGVGRVDAERRARLQVRVGERLRAGSRRRPRSRRRRRRSR